MRRSVATIVSIAMIILSLCFSAYAWFSLGNRNAITDPVNVDKPPTLFIKNSAGEDEYVLRIENLKAGDNYYVFATACVSDVTDASEQQPLFIQANPEFNLELTNTTNFLGDAVINLYSAEYSDSYVSAEDGETVLYDKAGYFAVTTETVQGASRYFTYDSESPLTSTDVSENMNALVYEGIESEDIMDLCRATYNLFSFVINPTLSFSTERPAGASEAYETSFENTMKIRFFVVKLTLSSTQDFAKETDLMYILANGATG